MPGVIFPYYTPLFSHFCNIKQQVTSNSQGLGREKSVRSSYCVSGGSVLNLLLFDSCSFYAKIMSSSILELLLQQDFTVQKNLWNIAELKRAVAQPT
jgi:hypothetical protein